MLSILPLLCFFTYFLVFQKSQADSCWRKSFLSASLVWGLLLTAITELLSTFKLIGFWEISGLWAFSLAVALVYLIRKNNRTPSLNIRLSLAGISRFELLLLTGVAFIVITVGIIGLLSPPNNWDSMTYHMSRVVHWIQNRSVAYYPTHILRQLHANPWAEFAILHFQVLTGGDRLANLVQWFSMLGTAIGVSLLAKHLGASTRGQVFAAAFSVTIPMGILQGSTTQTDYAVSFWLVCLTYFAMLSKENDAFCYSLATGTSLGLATLTKPTAYVYAFPFMAWISLSLVKSRSVRGLLQITLIVSTAIFINVGHYTRNCELYGNPLGPGHEGNHEYANGVFTLSSTTSNIIRNLGLHIGTPFPSVNSFLEDEIYKVHRVIGFETNDERTTWLGTKFFVKRLSLQEDIAGNPLHLIIIVISIPALIVQKHKKDVFYFLICLVSAFLLFCLYVRWQPWNSRLHLPLFILWSPLIGLSLSKIRGRWLADLCITLLLLEAIPYLLYNEARPILGDESILKTDRTRLYFSNRPSLAGPYTQSAQFVSNTGCSDIGLILSPNDYEYPLWVLLNQNNEQGVRIEHVNVTNLSQTIAHEYLYNAFIPCEVVVVSENPPDEISVGEVIYNREWNSEIIAVFMQK